MQAVRGSGVQMADPAEVVTLQNTGDFQVLENVFSRAASAGCQYIVCITPRSDTQIHG